MHIDLNEAIRIHARVGRARFGRSAKQRALKTAQTLRRAGDHAGAAVWERLAAEIDREGAKSPRAKHAPLSRPALGVPGGSGDGGAIRPRLR